MKRSSRSFNYRIKNIIIKKNNLTLAENYIIYIVLIAVILSLKLRGKLRIVKEKRLEPRICTAFYAKCTELSEKRNIFYTAIRDLSPGGVQILCDKEFPCGTTFAININLINANAEAKALVAWNDKKPNSDQYCVGLKFCEVNRKSRYRIENFIDRIYLDTIYFSCNCSEEPDKKSKKRI